MTAYSDFSVTQGGNVSAGNQNANMINIRHIVNGTDATAAPASNENLKQLRTDIDGIGVSPSGSISSYAGSSIPTGYLDCDGSAVSRTTYADLFTAISTTWGIGDGSTTFNLPDLRNAHLRGVGTSTIFTQNGTISLAQTVNDQFQSHRHQYDLWTGANLSGGGSNDMIQSSGSKSTSLNLVLEPSEDSPNGTPRTGAETSVKARGVYFIIKY